MALYTSLTGLLAAQTDLSVISNNIANVNSTGFKRSRADFGDIITSSPLQSPLRAIGAGTALNGIFREFSQGSIEATPNALDMALSGEGFFVLRTDPAGGDLLYSRSGAFTRNVDGYIVDAGGNHLQGLPVNADGVTTASGVGNAFALQIPEFSGDANSTDLIQTTVTLPQDAEVIPANPRYTAANPYVFNRLDPDSYNHSASTTVYDSNGASYPATLYYVRVDDPDVADPLSRWDVHVFFGDTEATATGPIRLEFSGGVLTSPATAVALPSTLPAPDAPPLLVNLQFGAGSVEADASFAVRALSQDGFPPGRLDGVSITAEGLLAASYTNGDRTTLGRMLLASFADPQGLRQLGNAHFATTGLSGAPRFEEPGRNGLATIISGSLEGSNVDLTEELVDLIAAQRNFQANARAIETDNAMTQSLLNIS